MRGIEARAKYAELSMARISNKRELLKYYADAHDQRFKVAGLLLAAHGGSLIHVTMPVVFEEPQKSYAHRASADDRRVTQAMSEMSVVLFAAEFAVRIDNLWFAFG